MNPVASDADGCQWTVPSRFFGHPDRGCGRAGYGSPIRLCWQHREAAYAQVVGDLYERPDGHLSNLLCDWVVSTIPTSYNPDSDERRQSREYALLALVRVAEHYGSDADAMPDHLAAALSPLIDRLIEQRMTQTWGAA